MAENKLHFNLDALYSMHRFGDIYAQAIREIDSKTVTFEVLREAKDSIGAHWYGMRCRATSKVSGFSFYFHTGLIYLPITKIGLMVEVDQKNNLMQYDKVVSELRDTDLFRVNRAEPEYLKLFMPDETFAKLNEADAATQKEMLKAYMQAAGEACVAVVDGTEGFRITEKDMLDAYGFANAFRKVVTETKHETFTTEINDKDPDNFGQYASGFRYWLHNASGSAKMYAYFGSIYSYKKNPAGLFAEIDWFSNQDVFDKVKANFKADPAFEYSEKEEKFIKLFMPRSTVEALNEADYDRQIEILKEFFTVCNKALAVASE